MLDILDQPIQTDTPDITAQLHLELNYGEKKPRLLLVLGKKLMASVDDNKQS